MEKARNANREYLVGDWLLENAQASESTRALLIRLIACATDCETIIESGLLHYGHLETASRQQAEACRDTGRPEDARLAAYYRRLQTLYHFLADHCRGHAFETFERNGGRSLNGESTEAFHDLIDEIRLRNPSAIEQAEPAEFAFDRLEIASNLFEEKKRRKFIAGQRRHHRTIIQLLGPEKLAGRKIPLYYLEPLCQLAETCQMIASEADLARFVVLPEGGWADCDQLAV